jgi:hypothetical protein
MSIQAPTQDELSVNDYFTMFNLYVVGTGKDLDDPDIRVKFMVGLTLDNQKEFIRFGVKKPLTEIIAYLKRCETMRKTKCTFGNLSQGSDSVLLFYKKAKKYNAILNIGEERLKHNFIRGLNSKNQVEAEHCYIIDPDISLEELVDRLSRLEALNKKHPTF